MKKIVFLDTKIPGDYLPNLNALSEYMNLPYEILPVGLSNCKMYIDSLVLNWRNETERKTLNTRISKIAKQSADYSVIFSQLETLVNLTDEKEIINTGFILINILFAPASAQYLKYNSDGSIESLLFEGISPKQFRDEENQFDFEINYANENLGKFIVEGIPFPKFLNQYQAMGRVIGQLLGISIANARKFAIILKQKNQIENYSLELQKSNNSKDKLFSIIAHDLKGPFNSLLGFSNLLTQEIKNEKNKNLQEYIHINHKTLNETFNLIENLLSWSQSQLNRIEYNPQSFHLLSNLNEIIPLLTIQAEKKKLALKIDIPEHLMIFGDMNMINTIFRNLISNAIKFTHENGLVLLTARVKNDTIQFDIIDTGVGMTPENVQELFSVENTKSKRGTVGEKGTGLGLLLCKDFIEKHQGKIWVESKLGKGSRFSFTLPFYSDENK